MEPHDESLLFTKSLDFMTTTIFYKMFKYCDYIHFHEYIYLLYIIIAKQYLCCIKKQTR